MIKREGTGQKKTTRRDFENAKKHTRRDVLLMATFSPALPPFPAFISSFARGVWFASRMSDLQRKGRRGGWRDEKTAKQRTPQPSGLCFRLKAPSWYQEPSLSKIFVLMGFVFCMDDHNTNLEPGNSPGSVKELKPVEHLVHQTHFLLFFNDGIP